MLLSCCYTGNYSYRENNVGNGLNDTPLPGKVWHFTDVHLDPLYDFYKYVHAKMRDDTQNIKPVCNMVHGVKSD